MYETCKTQYEILILKSNNEQSHSLTECVYLKHNNTYASTFNTQRPISQVYTLLILLNQPMSDGWTWWIPGNKYKSQTTHRKSTFMEWDYILKSFFYYGQFCYIKGSWFWQKESTLPLPFAVFPIHYSLITVLSELLSIQSIINETYKLSL